MLVLIQRISMMLSIAKTIDKVENNVLLDLLGWLNEISGTFSFFLATEVGHRGQEKSEGTKSDEGHNDGA